MKVAVVGATGMVGRKMLEVLEERNFPVDELYPVASCKSCGENISFRGQQYTVLSVEDAIAKRPDLALFSAGAEVSKEFAPQFVEQGTTVVDNSSAWRMQENVPLVIPEVNGNVLTINDKLIANPNCSTIQLLMALYPIYCNYGMERVIVSTYQSVTGTGKNAVEQMQRERAGEAVEYPSAYNYPIDKNCIPHCDSFLENDYTKEEMKLVHETHKILGDDSLSIVATAVRVPVVGGHSESVNVQTQKPFEISAVRSLLQEMDGVVVCDNPKDTVYPMPITAHEKDEVFVGRLRKDLSHPMAMNMWIVADNLRKGAATNTIQIAEYLLSKEWL